MHTHSSGNIRHIALRPVVLLCLLALPALAWQSPGASSGILPQSPNGGLPMPPQRPQTAYRPDNWPTSRVSDQDGPANVPQAYPSTDATRQGQVLQTTAHVEPINDVSILATVWSDPILVSDVMPYVNDVFNANKDQYPPEQQEKLRDLLVKQKLTDLIQTKIVVNDAKRTIPKENIKNVEKKVFEAFDKHELPRMMKKANCTSRAELDQKLRIVGDSLDHQKQAFFEKTLAQQWMLEQTRKDTSAEITHEEMLAYYRAHLADYEKPAKARWQQLMVRKSKDRPAGEAWQKLARMGNAVWYGASFAEVAKKDSEGVTAADGGIRDWTTKGSLVSKPLDLAVFNLEVGKLSEIIEDDQGFHIIVVLERVDATRTPFLEAQAGIKEKIKEERRNTVISKYLAEVKKKTPIWTVFDGQGSGQGQEQLTERPGAKRQ